MNTRRLNPAFRFDFRLVAGSQYLYDSSARLYEIGHVGTAGGSTFEEQHDYLYNNANQITQYTNLIDSILAEYNYDDRGQITGVDYKSTGPTNEDYQYDHNGNRELVDKFAGSNQDYDTGPYNRLSASA